MTLWVVNPSGGGGERWVPEDGRWREDGRAGEIIRVSRLGEFGAGTGLARRWIMAPVDAFDTSAARGRVSQISAGTGLARRWTGCRYRSLRWCNNGGQN